MAEDEENDVLLFGDCSAEHLRQLVWQDLLISDQKNSESGLSPLELHLSAVWKPEEVRVEWIEQELESMDSAQKLDWNCESDSIVNSGKRGGGNFIGRPAAGMG